MARIAGSLDDALASIRQEYGEASAPRERLSTGSRALDAALGGGWPTGAICELAGEDDTGKTTLALHLVAAAQRVGDVAWFDVDHGFSPSLAAALGVDLGRLLLARPSCGEELFDMLELLLARPALAAIVVDSAACVAPAAELRGALRLDIGRRPDAGDLARAELLARGLRRLRPSLERSGTLLLLTNQLRQQIDASWGPRRESTGGRGLRDAAAVRLRLEARGLVMRNGAPDGRRVRARVVSNVWGRAGGAVELTLRFGRGVDRALELVERALALGSLAWRDGQLFAGERTLGPSVESAAEVVARDHALAAALAGAVG